jgi:hypothetical protein
LPVHFSAITVLLFMTKLLEKAFQEAQKLSNNLQDEIAGKLLADIENELKWQETLADPNINLDVLSKMDQAALIEDQQGKTEAKELVCSAIRLLNQLE